MWLARAIIKHSEGGLNPNTVKLGSRADHPGGYSVTTGSGVPTAWKRWTSEWSLCPGWRRGTFETSSLYSGWDPLSPDSRTTYFYNFPLNIFRLWPSRVAETRQRKTLKKPGPPTCGWSVGRRPWAPLGVSPPPASLPPSMSHGLSCGQETMATLHHQHTEQSVKVFGVSFCHVVTHTLS